MSAAEVVLYCAAGLNLFWTFRMASAARRFRRISAECRQDIAESRQTYALCRQELMAWAAEDRANRQRVWDKLQPQLSLERKYFG